MANQFSSDKCGPCSFRGINNAVPNTWCLVCTESLCSICRDHHAALKATRSHELIAIDKLDKQPEVTENIRETCFEHDRKLEMFCSDHQEACCIKCGTSLHKNCTTVSPLDDIIRDVKSSVAFTSIQDGANALHSKLDTLIEMKTNSIDIFKGQADDIKKCMKEKLSDVVKKLENISEEAFSKVDKLESMNCTATNEVLVKLNKQLSEITELKTELRQIKEKGTDLQIFLCLKKLEARLSQAEDRLTFLIEKGELDSEEPTFTEDKNFEALSSLQEIGGVKSLKRTADLTFGSLGQSVKINEVNEQRQRDIGQIKLQKKIEMTLPEGSSVRNCVMLEKLEYSMLFTDYSDKKRLILFLS